MVMLSADESSLQADPSQLAWSDIRQMFGGAESNEL